MDEGWYLNGVKMYENNYRDGKLEGKQYQWYTNGVKKYEYNIEKGNFKGIQSRCGYNGENFWSFSTEMKIYNDFIIDRLPTENYIQYDYIYCAFQERNYMTDRIKSIIMSVDEAYSDDNCCKYR